MTCSTCRYFHAPDECRRHAPVLLPVYARTVYASTDGGSWCGDFEAAAAPRYVASVGCPCQSQRDHGEQ